MEEFNIVEKLLAMTLLGTEWVLWLLIISSVVSIAVILERAVYFIKLSIDIGKFSGDLTDKLAKDDFEGAEKLCKEKETLETMVALKGLENRENGPKVMEGSMEGLIIGQRYKLDRGLVILGTLGNNAPFIGLFGTTLGIIIAFSDLAANPEGGPSVVMAGISEALVATAVGLMVAIPAVIAFNFFNRIVKRHLANAEGIMKLILTYQQDKKFKTESGV